MVTPKTADGEFDIKNGYVVAPKKPGLGIMPRLDILGEPVISYS